jgi:hypothetical protein
VSGNILEAHTLDPPDPMCGQTTTSPSRKGLQSCRFISAAGAAVADTAAIGFAGTLFTLKRPISDRR